MTIRVFEERDLQEVLALIKRSDSTNRTKETWQKNDMSAMLAFEGDRLIGAIPFEKRRFVVSEGNVLKVLWVSAVHVDPEYRGQGIGSNMEGEIKKYFYPEFEAMIACREDEKSKAYQWYTQLGYKPLSAILSFKKDVGKSSLIVPEYSVWTTKAEIEANGAKMLQCFHKNMGANGGFCERDERFWAKKLEAHYYKESYAYSVLAVKERDQVWGYAFLGRTSMRDGIDRFDILEMIAPSKENGKQDLWASITDLAGRSGLKEIRIQLSEYDKNLERVKLMGFTKRWQTYVMGRMLNETKCFPAISWSYFHVDYI